MKKADNNILNRILAIALSVIMVFSIGDFSNLSVNAYADSDDNAPISEVVTEENTTADTIEEINTYQSTSETQTDTEPEATESGSDYSPEISEITTDTTVEETVTEEPDSDNSITEVSSPVLYSAPADTTEDEAAAISDDITLSKVTIKALVEYDNNIGGTDWTDLLQPSEYDETIQVITLIATLADGTTKAITVQDDASAGDFYLAFSYNSDGTGSFSILNVPNILDDQVVTSYEVTIVNDPEKLPYYTCNSFTVDPNSTIEISTLPKQQPRVQLM